ncbi:MAG: MFS transporter [Cellvibrionaceae bacterium]
MTIIQLELDNPVTDITFPHERRAVVSLALLYAFRMMGLFMVLPVLMLFGENYQDSSPALLGLALGAYGFSQALLQIPFGLWSDRWGRKPVIAVGLILFAIGSVVAALSDTVYGLILGRFLQGAGAIASAIMALAADLTSDQNRTKAMASIGASIGVSFSVALIIGPLVTEFGGLSAVFWLTSVFAAIGILILFFIVPNQSAKQAHILSSNQKLFGKVLKDKDLLRLDFGIFVLHFILMASFLVLPQLLINVSEIPQNKHSWVYLVMLVGAFVLMLPFILIAEKRKKIKPVFLGAVFLLGAMQLVLSLFYEANYVLLGGFFLFFVAFNLLEATLPSLLSKLAPAGTRGTANGIYSSGQFLGAFLGGALGGLILSKFGVHGVFILCASLAFMWLITACFMTTPRQLSSIQVTLDGKDQHQLLPQLMKLPGVAEVWYVEAERAAHLKVDSAVFQRESMAELDLC